MAELVADFVFDAAVEIIPPKPSGAPAHARICLCCQRPSKWIDDDGCGICDECLAPAWSSSRQRADRCQGDRATSPPVFSR